MKHKAIKANLVPVDPWDEEMIEMLYLPEAPRAPRNAKERNQWQNAGKYLTTFLRHDGCRKEVDELEPNNRPKCDTAGYFEWSDVVTRRLAGFRAATNANDPQGTVNMLSLLRGDSRKCRYALLGEWKIFPRREVPGL